MNERARSTVMKAEWIIMRTAAKVGGHHPAFRTCDGLRPWSFDLDEAYTWPRERDALIMGGQDVVLTRRQAIKIVKPLASCRRTWKVRVGRPLSPYELER